MSSGSSSVSEIFAAYAQGRYQDAADGFTVSIQTDPTNPQHYLNRAASYLAIDLYRKAVQDCDDALKINENLERAYLIKGRAQFKMGKQKLARKIWRQGARIASDVVIFKEIVTCLGGDTEEKEEITQTSSTPAPVETPLTLKTPSSISKRLDSKLPPVLDAKSWDALASAAVGQIQYGIGDFKIDKIIALGYYHVNSGQLADGIQVFDALLAEYPKLVAAYLGRGTAYALGNQLDKAIADFTSAISCDETCSDAYKRRGQCRSARGNDNEALEDFTKAVELTSDHESYHQRGLVYYRKKNYKRAVLDFESATKVDHSDPLTWNYVGLCYDALGKCHLAVESHMKAISLKADFKEAYCNLGQAYKDWGKIDLSLENFNKALALDSTYSHAYHLRGFAYFGIGDHYQATQDMKVAIYHNPTHLDSHIMSGVSNHGVGFFKDALVAYNCALKVDPQNPVWYQKEIALWWHHRLDWPNSRHNMDLDLDPQFKEFWCKRLPPSLLKTYKPQPDFDHSIPNVEYNPKPKSAAVLQLLQYSYWYGRMLHQEAPGYLSNKRQQRMAGFATLQVAQVLRDYWFKNVDYVEEKMSTYNKGVEKRFNWRYIYDIIIRWRQFSEPNDPVWWVDLLTPEQFAEGFGSHTPMITGQCHVVRYSPMIELSFPIMKEEMIKQKNLSEKMKQRVREATSCDDLYDVMRRDFWIVTPCHSLRTGKILEGTRLTLQRTDPEGYEFSIRTPGTPPRWIDYDLELQYIFGLLTQAVREDVMDIEKVSDLILTVTFYWYNFMPLSRGTAAAGYIALVGMFLAIGIKINTLVPPKFLVDWQGILRPTPTLFMEQLKPWLYPSRVNVDLDEFDRLPNVASTFPTLRTMIEGLNCESVEK